MNILKGLGKAYKEGFSKSVENMGLAEGISSSGYTPHSAVPIVAKGAYGQLAQQGIGFNTPVKLVGATTARVMADLGQDATRHLYWRYNHPMAISDKVAESAFGDQMKRFNAAQRGAISLATVGLPVGASLGTFDITNVGELGRPKGYAQSYAEKGSEDRRETSQVAPELLERFVLGRQGRPLKFETAKEDIPDLTKERYSNYMNYLYNDKGLVGAGLIKGTTENLYGEPELRIVGFPVGLQAAGALAGGTLAGRAALKTLPKNVVETKGKSQQVTRRVPLPAGSTRKVAAIGGAGALAGAAVGKLINRAIATQGQSDLPSTQEYGITSNEITSMRSGITPERTLNGSPEGELVMASLRGYGPYPQLEKLGLNTPEKLERRRQELIALYD
tara:strand:+ start:1340 stop:2509 length:1170 start_codon:yes stop_codon:yes gene_type:complete